MIAEGRRDMHSLAGPVAEAGPGPVREGVDESALAAAMSQAAVDLPRIEAAVREILLAVGEDPDRPGLTDTPRRVARAYAEMCAGLRTVPAVHLGRTFEQVNDDAIIVRDIRFFSLCEHHLLPFSGQVHLAYLPAHGRVVGLSKLARTVEAYARRPQMQERLTNQIADALARHLDARGVAVVIEGEHYCMKMRGVRQSEACMVTTAFRGALRCDAGLRSSVLTLLQPNRLAGTVPFEE